MVRDFAELSRQLSAQAEAVCRHYLSNGHRQGRYWLVGNVYNSPGGSMYVRLVASDGGRGAAGKWTDAGTGEHGDLLDVIALSQGHLRKRETLDEARRFLSLAPAIASDIGTVPYRPRTDSGTPVAARRLFAASRPIAGTIAEDYLRKRGLYPLSREPALRFHPNCYYRAAQADAPGTRRAWPALIAAVTDGDNIVTSVQRTWIDPLTLDKAPVAAPRRALGGLLGRGVRFGPAGEIMAAGEGIETILSLRNLLPEMPLVAGLSSAHLAELHFPPQLRRLYVARDNDDAGKRAFARLQLRGDMAEIEVLPLIPVLGDFNDDLRLLGSVYQQLQQQLLPEDAKRFLDRLEFEPYRAVPDDDEPQFS